MSESPLVKDTRLLLSHGDVRLFRNNVGVLQDRNGNYIQFGLAIGSGDLIGFKSVNVTPEMVGQVVAILVSLEAKTGRGRESSEQMWWRGMVQNHGGITGVFRTVDEAREILK